MSNKVIHRSQLPTRLPVTFAIAVYLLLDKLQAPGWVWGIAVTLLALVCISAVIGVVRELETKIDL